MAETPATSAHDLRQVSLDHPLTRGDQKVTCVALRRPKAGELRGISLVNLAQLDVDELRKLLPRITVPVLAAIEVDNLDPSDLLALGAEVADFLLPNSAKQAHPRQ